MLQGYDRCCEIPECMSNADVRRAAGRRDRPASAGPVVVGRFSLATLLRAEYTDPFQC